MFPSSAIVDRLQADLGRDLVAFLPELILCAAIVGMLLIRLFSSLQRVHVGYVAMLASGAAFLVALAQWRGDSAFDPGVGHPFLFTGLLAYDPFAIYVRLFLLAFLTLTLWLTLLTGIPDRDDAADFTTLLLGSTLGMMLMASANHLLTVFLAVEMASVPSYALAGFLKGKKQGSEAALKYVVYGASASGVMLYGISLLAGKFGTGYLPDLALGYRAMLTSGNGLDAVLIAGTLFVFVGLAFKLAAVPFHFWCPDVFEGAAAEVAAFLSVASKGAALALTARFLLNLAGPAGSQTVLLLEVPFGLMLAVIAALTATLGNLAALGQTNLKRLLAYSTIAHAGYMLMALVTLSATGASAVLFYLVAYSLMNLGAFACVAFLRNANGSEDLADFAGVIHRSPFLVAAFALFLLSLLGIPPLVGFAAKFQVFAVLFDMGQIYGDQLPLVGYALDGLLVVAAVNTVVSAAYYLKILRVMILDAPPPGEPIPQRNSIGATAFLTLLAGSVIAAGVLWNPLTKAANRAVEPFQTGLRSGSAK